MACRADVAKNTIVPAVRLWTQVESGSQFAN